LEYQDTGDEQVHRIEPGAFTFHSCQPQVQNHPPSVGAYFQRAFSLPATPDIPLHSVILRHPPLSGSELWLNSPDLDAFSLFYQPSDTTLGAQLAFLEVM
jgi:hypothetical protein